MRFINYPKCSTCVKAKNYLDNLNLSYENIDIKLDNPDVDTLKNILTLSKLPIKRLFNTSGLVYKALGLKDKLDSMTDEEKFAILATDGMLVKRPLLVGDDFALIGFKQKEWDEALLPKHE